MKKLLIIALVFIASSFCKPNVTVLSDTWAGNSANQAVTYKALRNSNTTGGWANVFPEPPDTREVYTKNDLASYPLSVTWYDGTYDISDTFSSFGSGQAITRTDIERTLACLNATSGFIPSDPFTTTILYLPKGRLISTMAVGDQLYSNRQSTATYAPGTTKYFIIGFSYAYLTVSSSGIITNITFP